MVSHVMSHEVPRGLTCHQSRGEVARTYRASPAPPAPGSRRATLRQTHSHWRRTAQSASIGATARHVTRVQSAGTRCAVTQSGSHPVTQSGSRARVLSRCLSHSQAVCHSRAVILSHRRTTIRRTAQAHSHSCDVCMFTCHVHRAILC